MIGGRSCYCIPDIFAGASTTGNVQLHEHCQPNHHRMQVGEPPLFQCNRGERPPGDYNPEHQRSPQLRCLHHFNPDKYHQTIGHWLHTVDHESHIHLLGDHQHVHNRERAHRQVRGGLQSCERVALHDEECHDRLYRPAESAGERRYVVHIGQRVAEHYDVFDIPQHPHHRDHRLQIQATEVEYGVHPGRGRGRQEQRVPRCEYKSERKLRHNKQYLRGRQKHS